MISAAYRQLEGLMIIVTINVLMISLLYPLQCFNANSVIEKEDVHHHGKFHPPTEIMPRILQRLAQGQCIDMTATTSHQEDHFKEILQAINASSRVVMTYQDFTTLTMKITSNKKCSNCVSVKYLLSIIHYNVNILQQ